LARGKISLPGASQNSGRVGNRTPLRDTDGEVPWIQKLGVVDGQGMNRKGAGDPRGFKKKRVAASYRGKMGNPYERPRRTALLPGPHAKLVKGQGGGKKESLC